MLKAVPGALHAAKAARFNNLESSAKEPSIADEAKEEPSNPRGDLFRNPLENPDKGRAPVQGEPKGGPPSTALGKKGVILTLLLMQEAL